MSFYRFPEIKNKRILNETTNDCVHKIVFEVGEARDVLDGIGGFDGVMHGRLMYGMELMDVIHAAETALRFDFSNDEVEQMRKDVESKNRDRGYYDEEDAQGGDVF